jgi:hypothetical protein
LKSLLLRALGLAACVVTVGCSFSTRQTSHFYDVPERVPARQLPPTIDFEGMPLRSGQIVLSESPYSTSFMFSLIPAEYHYFTHAAILVIDRGEPWVYEMTGEISSFPLYERPLDNINGKVLRRRLMDYAGPNLYVEIVEPPPGTNAERIAEYAREVYRRDVPFDPYFRFDDHRSLYCTEFVELALRSGGAAPNSLGPASQQRSLAVAKRWLGVPMDEALPAAYFYDSRRTVAALGQFPYRAAAAAYFEAKREIYWRLQQPDQRLGFIFRLDTTNIELRPEIERFAFNAARLFDRIEPKPAWGDPRIRAEVRRYADATFGPGPAAPSDQAPGAAVLSAAPVPYAYLPPRVSTAR